MFDAEGNRVVVPGVTTCLSVINKPFLKAWASKLCMETIRDRLISPDGTVNQLSTEEYYALFEEAKNKHRERLETAGDIGHIAHDCLEQNIKKAIAEYDGVVKKLWFLPEHYIGTPDFFSTQAQSYAFQAYNCVQAAFGWIIEHNVRFTHTERKIYSKILHVAGTLDGLALVDSCCDPMCRGCRGREWKDQISLIDWKSSNQLSIDYALQTAPYVFAHVEEFGTPIEGRWVLRLGKTEGDFEPWYLDQSEFEGDLKAFEAALTLYKSLDVIESKRSADKKSFTEMVRSKKRAAKAAAKEEEKAEKAAERARVKMDKRLETELKKALYKTLRAEGKSVTEATQIVYPEKTAKAVAIEQIAQDSEDQGVYDQVLLPDEMQVTPTIENEDTPFIIRF
jgi:hypothetical protein